MDQNEIEQLATKVAEKVTERLSQDIRSGTLHLNEQPQQTNNARPQQR